MHYKHVKSIAIATVASLTACVALVTPQAEATIVRCYFVQPDSAEIMQNLVDNNLRSPILASYDSVSAEIIYEEYTQIIYVDDTMTYRHYEFGDWVFSEVFTADGEYIAYDGTGYMHPMQLTEDSPTVYELLDSEEVYLSVDSARERVIATDMDEDTYTVQTLIELDKNTDLDGFAGYVEDPAYQADDLLSITYTADAATHALLSVEETFLHADGTETAFSTYVMTHNTEVPADVDDLLAHLVMEETDALRTVTVVFDPNTEAETTYVMQVPLGDGVTFIMPDAYLDAPVYLDADCTVVYEGGASYFEDLTLYIPAIVSE